MPTRRTHTPCPLVPRCAADAMASGLVTELGKLGTCISYNHVGLPEPEPILEGACGAGPGWGREGHRRDGVSALSLTPHL